MKKHRALNNKNNEDAINNGWKMVIPFVYECIGKSTYEGEDLKIIKSTKRITVDGGYLYNVSTEIHSKGGSVSVAEAVTFQPFRQR